MSLSLDQMKTNDQVTSSLISHKLHSQSEPTVHGGIICVYMKMLVLVQPTSYVSPMHQTNEKHQDEKQK